MFFYHKTCVFLFLICLSFLTSHLICCCCCLFVVVVVDDIVVVCFFFLLLLLLVSLSFYLLFSCGGRQLCVLLLLSLDKLRVRLDQFSSSFIEFQVKQNVTVQLATVYLCDVGIGRLIVICSVFFCCYTYKYTMWQCLQPFRLHSLFFLSSLTENSLSLSFFRSIYFYLP